MSSAISLGWRLLLALGALGAAARAAESVPATRVDTGTLAGKVMVGYQGWFNAEGDGARRGYNHWSRGGAKPAPGNVRVDLWPDLSEFPAAERFPTDLVHADGSRAEVFSSFLRPTVVRHFAWMQEHGIDGAFLQRFINSLARGTSLAANNAVLENVRAGARQHGRVYALMYDLSSLAPGKAGVLIADWKQLLRDTQLTRDPRTCATTASRSSPSGAAVSRITTNPAPRSRTGARSSPSSRRTPRAAASRSCSECPPAGGP